MGYKLAGFDVVGNCEIDPNMMKVYKQNNHPKNSFLMDIRDFLKLPDEKIPEELFHLDALFSQQREAGKKAGIRKRCSGKDRPSRGWMTCSYFL